MLNDIVGVIAWLALSFAAAFLGSRFLPDAWYAGLRKPAWNPPNKVFGPVWSVLYLLMGFAAWLVWRQGGVTATALPLTLFVAQLLLNAGWSWLFFGRHRPDAALAEMSVLWLAIAATLITFLSVDRLAGLLLVPYLAWVSFAAFLNYTIWRLNSPFPKAA